jgi:hypothetical protein
MLNKWDLLMMIMMVSYAGREVIEYLMTSCSEVRYDMDYMDSSDLNAVFNGRIWLFCRMDLAALSPPSHSLTAVYRQ